MRTKRLYVWNIIQINLRPKLNWKSVYYCLKNMSLHRIRARGDTKCQNLNSWIYRKRKALAKTYLTSKFFSELKGCLAKLFSKRLSGHAQSTCQKYMTKAHAQFRSFFLCCIIITKLLSTSLKSELEFLLVSEMGKFHKLALNFKDWPFGVIVTRHFRPKCIHLNERVYCKLIHRTSKMLFIKELGSFLRPNSSKLRKLLVFG